MKILVTLDIPEVGVELLKIAGFEVSVWKEVAPMDQEELINRSKNMDALLCTSVDKIDQRFLNQCSHLSVISQFAAGYDNIDIQEAIKLKIPIGNAPDAMSDATADIAFTLMLTASRKLCFLHKSIISDNWEHFVPKSNLGLELKNKILGVFGLGRIGFEMAKRCKGAYDMEIIYCNRNQNEEADDKLEARKVTFDELLEKSDVLSVHCALNDETRGLFNSSAFMKMKDTSIFVNTSRGPVHNEQHLIEALEQGMIWGAGLDVTNPEPMKADNPLLSMENVAITPHIGSATIVARDEMSRRAAENIIEFFKNGRVPYRVA